MDVDDFLPISALQHLSYCPRQCALIHVERLWEDNVRTVEGKLLHERADEPGHERRAGVRTERALWLRSERLRLVGRADVVEFCREGAVERPHPVEYKRGLRGDFGHNELQLCAQAMALEEMLGVEVPKGALFYGKTRRRRDVVFDCSLRERTVLFAERLHAMVRDRLLPVAEPGPRCEHCSLRGLCMPEVSAGGEARAQRYLARLFSEQHGDGGEP
ncbi:MAG: CRISPR-associated protein Cas4 [Deltaproteobacteria bacterium]|nr:CRISPR-associated protein Cas4 [Deltaproteobacteria bacterium]